MPMAFVALTPIILALLALLVRSDARPERCAALALNGAALGGWSVVVARSYLNRRVGLLNHSGLGPGDGLWLTGTRAVHGRGMVFPIDVVFLAGDGTVLAVHAGLAPGFGRLSGPQGTSEVLEIAAGGIARLGLAPGDRLQRQSSRAAAAA
jgi:uncharacterized membrane protein (UPF0127 family)